jgi:hypothetical protein
MYRVVPIFALVSLGFAAPNLRELSPRGGQRGTTIQLVLKGSELKTGAQLQTTIPASFSRLAPSKETMRPDSELPFLVEIKRDAPVGLYPIRVLTDDGLSNLLLFSVGEFVEVEEAESAEPKQSNGDPKSAQPVSAPATVNGTLPEADVDVYSFEAKAGQRLVFEVEASVMASAIDPAIELLDSAGKTLARNDDAPGNGIDPRIDHTFRSAGRYFVRVHDSKYSDQTANFYRLKIGSYPYAEALFPLGWKRSEPVTVHAIGGSFARPEPVKVDTAVKSRLSPVRVVGSASLPLLFELSDQKEILEPEAGGEVALEPDVILNGRIAKPKEVDRFKVAVKPGEHWIFDLRASALGSSRLDALLTVYDASGKKLASRDDLGSADPVLPLEIPEKTTEITVAVEDLLGRGGPAYGYRLQARREPADFIVRLNSPFVNVPAGGTAIVNVTLQRRGYDGAARIEIPNLPKGFTVAGGHIAPAAASQRFDDPNPRFSAAASTLTITADPDVKPQNLELQVIARAGDIVRRAEGPGLVTPVRGLRQKAITAEWLGTDLPMAVSKPLPVKLSSPIPLVRISQGVEFPLNYKIERGLTGKVIGKLRETIATQVGNLRILQGPPGKSPDSGSMLVNTNFATPTTKFDMLTSVTGDLDGKQVEIYAPIVTFEVVPGYRVLPDSSEWRAQPGKPFQLAGSIYREPSFEGEMVKLEVNELPEGVACRQTDVQAWVSEFSIDCQIASTAAKGAHEIQIASQAPDTGTKAKDTYKVPVVPGKLIIQ